MMFKEFDNVGHCCEGLHVYSQATFVAKLFWVCFVTLFAN